MLMATLSTSSNQLVRETNYFKGRALSSKDARTINKCRNFTIKFLSSFILGSIDISESDLNNNDRLKSKLRSGVSIHSNKRAQILKRIILGDKPIVDGNFVTENNTDTTQFGGLLEKSCYFESSLFTG